jgi:hypothetical protein
MDTLRRKITDRKLTLAKTTLFCGHGPRKWYFIFSYICPGLKGRQYHFCNLDGLGILVIN